ncbi:MAG: hypothetical protein WAO83_15385 [Fuerstiella sp.]
MKRTTSIAAMTLIVLCSTASTSHACFCMPWLNPFNWLGFHGCGNYGGCGYQTYGYQQPIYSGYQQPMYAAPQMLNYPVAPTSPGCGCTGAVQPQQTMSAVRVPVTNYRAVTQYVPQTTYQTQYQYSTQQAVAYAQPTMSYAQPSIAYSQPSVAYDAYGQNSLAYGVPSYNTAALPMPMPEGTSYPPTMTPPTYPAPMYSAPTIFQASPNVATPSYSGDVHGDHEYPSQSAVTPSAPIQWYQNKNAIRPVSYSVSPVSAKSYSATVR